MGDLPDPDVTPEVTRLRELRAGLEQFVRELMTWIGLLRHKALALRAVSSRSAGASPDPLAPGSLDPRALAEALASGMSKLRSRPAVRNPLRLAGISTEDAIQRARALWDTVVDPRDTLASENLAISVERLAEQLEDRVNEALDEYDALGEELDRALARQPLDDTGDSHPADMNPAESSAHNILNAPRTPGRNP